MYNKCTERIATANLWSWKYIGGNQNIQQLFSLIETVGKFIKVSTLLMAPYRQMEEYSNLFSVFFDFIL